MKKRMGFVSNSSSSSFCILGIPFKESELVSKWNLVHPDNPVGTIWSIWNKITMCNGIEKYYDLYVVGESIESLSDNKTILEQKKEVAEKINSLFGTSLSEGDIAFHVDGGREG